MSLSSLFIFTEAKSAPDACFEFVNSNGDRFGNCGYHDRGYRRCETRSEYRTTKYSSLSTHLSELCLLPTVCVLLCHVDTSQYSCQQVWQITACMCVVQYNVYLRVCTHHILSIMFVFSAHLCGYTSVWHHVFIQYM